MPEFRAVELGIFAVYPTRKQLPVWGKDLRDVEIDVDRTRLVGDRSKYARMSVGGVWSSC